MDTLSSWGYKADGDQVSYTAPIYGPDHHARYWAFVEWDPKAQMWRAQIKHYSDTQAIRMSLLAESFRPTPQAAQRWVSKYLTEEHVVDNDFLRGTEIPTEWTLNSGENKRPLEVGMEIRYQPGGPAYPVLKVNAAGALVRGAGRNVTMPNGASFKSTGPPVQISLYSEVEYRRKRDRKGEWEGLDEHYQDMIGSENEGDNASDNQGGRQMANAAKIPASGTAKGAPAKKAPAKLVDTKGATKKAAAPAKKAAKVNGEEVLNDCICGCGGKTGKFFVPGHDARFKGWLSKIAKGEAKPSDLMPATLAKALGPWTTKGDGQVPTKSYRDLRA